MVPLFAFFNSPLQWLIVGIIILLLFGNRLPSVMRSLGQGLTEFKKGLNEGSTAAATPVESSPAASAAPAVPASQPKPVEEAPKAKV